MPWYAWYAGKGNFIKYEVRLSCDLPWIFKRIPLRYGDIFLFAVVCDVDAFLLLEGSSDLHIQRMK